MEVVVMGRMLGTASGWDEADTMAIVFYKYNGNSYDLLVNFETGKVHVGLDVFDALDWLSTFPKAVS